MFIVIVDQLHPGSGHQIVATGIDSNMVRATTTVLIGAGLPEIIK